jgi:RNA-directed DNA polymerase
MDEGDAQRKAEMPEDSRKAAGGTRENTVRERQAFAAAKENAQPEMTKLFEEVLRRENLIAALRRVQSNKGAPGVDGMTVEALTPYLKTNWPRIREEFAERRIHPRARPSGRNPETGRKGNAPARNPHRARSIHRTSDIAGAHSHLRSAL